MFVVSTDMDVDSNIVTPHRHDWLPVFDAASFSCPEMYLLKRLKCRKCLIREKRILHAM